MMADVRAFVGGCLVLTDMLTNTARISASLEVGKERLVSDVMR
jgi:hypothetical protein